MHRVCRMLERAVEAAAAVMVAVFATVILADVVCRYWLHIPIPWVSEFTVLLFQVTAFLGSALALRRGIHFGLGLVLPLAWPRLQRPMAALVAVIVGAASLLLAVLAVRMARQTWDATYATLRISHGWAYVAVAASACLMLLFAVEAGVRSLRGAGAAGPHP